MRLVYTDFNGATGYFAREGLKEWREIEGIASALPIFLQSSDQKGKGRSPIFDPKGTNSYLTAAAKAVGWVRVPVPLPLTAFGLDWDAGKGETLAEWQFSNYPFLWNNVIRSEAVFTSKTALAGVKEVKALIILTKSGVFPASNSTLYYEQAKAQLDAVTKFGAFTIPIRLVGLTVPDAEVEMDVKWTAYPARYSRKSDAPSEDRRAALVWRRKKKFGYDCAAFRLIEKKVRPAGGRLIRGR